MLEDLRAVVEPLDLHFAFAMRRIAGEEREQVLAAAALASRAVQHGHVCLDLRRVGREPLLDENENSVELRLPDVASWIAALRTSPLVGDGSTLTPLVLEAERLYLYRYYDYERRLAAALRARVAAPDEPVHEEGLQRLFDNDADEQRMAVRLVLTRRLAVVSGGPGTGKTTTVAKMLALLQERALSRGAPLRIALLSPTGKAAARLGESIRARIAELDGSEAVKAAVLASAAPATLHRALGFDAAAPTRFRHGPDNPLAADVVIVDEASMVDLALMTKLAEAVRPEAHLVLLGDKDQLASVEAGAILGDIYHAPGLRACTCQLTKSYRYDAQSGIGSLALAINRGDPEETLAVLRSETTMPYGRVALCSLDEQRPLAGTLGATVREGFADYLSTSDPFERLERLTRFRVLCVHRRGPLGASTMNLAIERHLAAHALLEPAGTFYDGRPILVTRNDYQLALFNGDIGVVGEHDGRLRAAFPSESARAVRWIDLGRLPPHETVFAMTVHKSQGSEFDRVALLLPASRSPILTRELVYTGVSRARDRVDIYGSPAILREAIGRRIERTSGLSHGLGLASVARTP